MHWYVGTYVANPITRDTPKIKEEEGYTDRLKSQAHIVSVYAV